MKCNLNNVVKENFSRYAGNVILDRAICDVRDMLKPSARMLMYSQRKITKSASDKEFVKSARVVGDALGRFYTHGDSSCYGTYMRMAKPFAMRYPLEECQGNSGTIIATGDEAAMRYTELRPSKVSDFLFNNIEKNTNEWKDNFDETLKYPAVLPSIGFYNIVNGTTGIGVSISSSIPQFNLNEVNNAIIKLIENPNAPFDMIYCPPDFATGGTIMNAAETKESLRDGSGKSIRLRAKVHYDSKKNTLVVTELPYGVYSGTITEEIESILKENEDYGIESINDGSGSTVNYTIELSKDVNPSIMLERLYKDTSLENHFTVNMTMLDNGRFPKVFGWREALLAYVKHIRECKRRELEFDKEALLRRNHILDGLRIALANIDEVVATIRNSDSPATARVRLMKNFKLDEEQANAILNMKLQRLANLEAIKVNTEYNNNAEKIDKISDILGNQNKLDDLLIVALREVANLYGDKRRTELCNEAEREDIQEQEVILSVYNGTIKPVKRSTKNTINTTNLGRIIVITENGKIHKIPVSSILEHNSSKIETLIKDSSKVIYIGDLSSIKLGRYWIFITRNGFVKKSMIGEYNYFGQRCSKVMNLNEDDVIVNCMVSASNDDVISIGDMEIPLSSIGVTGKGAKGSLIRSKNETGV